MNKIKLMVSTALSALLLTGSAFAQSGLSSILSQDSHVRQCLNEHIRAVVGDQYKSILLNKLLSHLKSGDKEKLLSARSEIMQQCAPKKNQSAALLGEAPPSDEAQCCGGNWLWVFGYCSGTLYWYPDYCAGGSKVCSPEGQCHG